MKLKYFTTIISCFAGTGLIVCGVVMAFKGITANGVIDIKSTLLSGKIESGSLGLLFSFLGAVLLLVPLYKKYEVKTVYRKKTNEQEIDWSHWESGDPYADLQEEIFPNENIPLDVSNQPFADWMSESKIEEMIDLHLQSTLINTSNSFLDYHYSNDPNKAKEISKAIAKTLQQIITGSKSNELILETHNLTGRNFLEELIHILTDKINWYFKVKKRIFAGYDKYPSCSPPVHEELAKWIESIEKKWINIIQDFKRLTLPNL